jgi:hypothetical protein
MALERIFAHFKPSENASTAAYDPTDPNSYFQFIQAMITDARDYEGSVLAKDRNEAQLYYYGYKPTLNPDGGPYTDTYYVADPNATYSQILGHDDESANRSSYVSTDVRDAVMLMLPSLIRLFGASEAPVNLVPRGPGEADLAQQATDYVNYTFWNDNPGFLILYGAFKDALTVKTGFVKWWTDDHKEIKQKTFLNITAEQIQMVLSEDSTARIVSVGKPLSRPNPRPRPPAGPAGPPTPNVGPPAGPLGMAQPNAALASPPGGPPAGPPAGALAGGSGGPANPMIGGVPPPPGAPPAPGAAMAGQASMNMPPAGPPPGPMAGAPPPNLPAVQQTPPPAIYDHVVFSYEVSKPLIRVAGVPPEEMRLDRYARTFRESRIVGHERVIPVDQLVGMGYDRELCMNYIQSQEIQEFTMESQLRNPGRFMSTRVGDGVLYGEWYIKIDKNADGVPELRYICTMGEIHDIVADEEANRIKFALFSCDPISHTIVGDSLNDYVEDIQRIKTNMMRAILDSAAESINPKTVINELTTTVDDALNDDLGAVIRTRGDPKNAVAFNNIPFLGQQALPVIELLNAQLQRRTGLSDAAKGLDPKALQSSTMLGVEAVINGAQERTEMVARVLAETGFKDLFSGLYNEICENPNQDRTLQIRGNFIPYDTGTFDASMSVEVNPNLGKGSDLTRMLALNQIKQDQQLILTTYGLNNPVCGIPEMLNTITDILAIANVKNVGRYFKTPTPQQLQAIMSAPKTPDPQAVLAQAQLEKARSDTAIATGKQQIDLRKMQLENTFKHQQLQAKTAYDFQKLEIEAKTAGMNHFAALADISSQLMKDQSDSDQNDQENQVAMAGAQNDATQTAQQGQAAQNDAQLQAAQIATKHMQAMAQIHSGHVQAMTDMAARHHQAMTGHAVKGAQVVAGALSGQADREHETDENALDRGHDALTTAATLANQQTVAKMKPRPNA